ncbi:Spy/CpxP family protein refolding chaperone [Aliifodinibius sp. S!AR15-10]|uniref:Spy/CpxP family protein refolding chaperone n=1 Tax=Aliifodinibius sp. S!AR15-10 TaxID=2950437 RepID=UPI0028569D98|nr:Spy/CpxP family protein refolding chaperone [Aliifodinibius sp. S!AR15-10]MDR8391520.1 Spy/CpxP family protein refolding chaperone [Aliifodinibius sp. S!AR15-10]
MKYYIPSLILLFTFMFAETAAAQQGRRAMAERPHFQRGNMEYMLPDLTDEQREQIRDIRLKAQEESLDLRNQLNEKRARLRTLTTGGDEIDTEAANQVIEEVGALRTELMKQHLQTRMNIRELLTDEQKVVFDSHGAFGGNFGDMKFNRRGMRFHHR